MSGARFLLIDGNNVTLRAMHACPPLSANGVPTGCFMTSIRTLCRIADKIRPNRVIWFWDRGHAQFRKDLYPEYKQRPKKDEDEDNFSGEADQFYADWKTQTKMLEEHLSLLGVMQIAIKGCEADDLIYRVASFLGACEHNTISVSTDADFMQMLSDNCYVFNPKNEKLYTPDDLYEEYGIKPDQWVEYRAMMGDPSDNIKGVQGIGKKRALEVLTKYGSVDKFVDYVIGMKVKKYEESLLGSLEIVDRNKKLMDLSQAPLDIEDRDEMIRLLTIGLDITPDLKKFWNVCQKYKLQTLLVESPLWTEVYGD